MELIENVLVEIRSFLNQVTVPADKIVPELMLDVGEKLKESDPNDEAVSGFVESWKELHESYKSRLGSSSTLEDEERLSTLQNVDKQITSYFKLEAYRNLNKIESHLVQVGKAIQEIEDALKQTTIPVDQMIFKMMLASGNRLKNTLQRVKTKSVDEQNEVLAECKEGIPQWVASWTSMQSTLKERLGKEEDDFDKEAAQMLGGIASTLINLK